MEPRKLSDTLSVAPQLEPADIAGLAVLGYRTVIDNRPDEEVDPAHSSAEIARLCTQHGLAFHYLPYYPGEMTLELVQTFEAIIAKAERPVFSYCRSGTRSSHLWAMSQAGYLSNEQIVAAAARAGYDHSALVPALRVHAANRPGND